VYGYGDKHADTILDYVHDPRLRDGVALCMCAVLVPFVFVSRERAGRRSSCDPKGLDALTDNV